MRIHDVRKTMLLGLGLSATLAFALSGCGGDAGNKDDAVIVKAPDAKTSTASSSTSTTAPTPATSGGATPSTSTSTGSAAPVKAEGWGTLKGTVVFSGTVPEAKLLQAQGKAEKNPEVCAKSAPIFSERLVVDSGTKGVKNVFVYLLRPTAVNEDAKKAALAKKVVFDQKECVYIPHALAVIVGEPVDVKSSDSTTHNVNFQLKNLQSNPVLQPGANLEVVPSSAERTPGPVSCSIHPWMQAYWMVLDHPYFAVTDEKGNFEIKNVPAGTQKVVVWQEAVGSVTASSGDDVTIAAGGDTTKSFTIDSSKVRPGS